MQTIGDLKPILPVFLVGLIGFGEFPSHFQQRLDLIADNSLPGGIFHSRRKIAGQIQKSLWRNPQQMIDSRDIGGFFGRLQIQGQIV